MMKNKIKIITPFYNPGDFLENCVSSLVSQKYDNFEMIFVDDMSTDGSYEKLPHDDDRALIIKNTVRKTALENLHNAIMDHCDPDDIVVIVDGDDWLDNRRVLSYINDQYNELDPWIFYGQSNWTNGQRGFATEYTEKEFENIRKAPFKISHLRTFRAGLYHKMKDQDPDFSGLKDSSGDFYKSSYDTAMMFPLLEMAGKEKTVFNDTILYIYNRDNPISDDKVDQNLQWSVHGEVSEKRNLNKIESYS